ncbi:MAG: hypothetical protein O2840_04105 [bacterium]|nr:hypothetical protein [bacterium]
MLNFDSYFTKKILKNFFSIELSSIEREVALDSVRSKYSPVLRNSIILTLLSLPAIVILDSSIVVNVLIPITMVAGTAWFSVSLSSVKKKFEAFGLELTIDMLESFMASLFLLLAIAFASLNAPLVEPYIAELRENTLLVLVSSMLGTIVVARIILKIFYGAVKYDINDAMLAGQAEIAERFFKKSLSFFHDSAQSLRSGKSVEVANYHIGNSFYELFSYIKTNLKSKGLRNGELEALIGKAADIKSNPSSAQKKIDATSIELIKKFLGYCQNASDLQAKKSMQNIELELKMIENNKAETQNMTDTRFATIFTEIADLVEKNGESLFG